MTHEDAVHDLAVERYLLGELSGDVRERFEEHLFDCRECAADVKDGVLFLEAARTELREPVRAIAPAERKTAPRSFAWLWQGWTLGPALAACLGVIAYQSAVVLPHMRTELAQTVAQLETPAVVTPLVLANAGARGDSVASVVTPQHGFYLLSIDIPPAAGATGYRCSLYSPTGALTWHVDVSPEQARDAVTIQVPVMTAQEGMNELRVQSILASPANGDKLGDLTSYRFQLSVAK